MFVCGCLAQCTSSGLVQTSLLVGLWVRNERWWFLSRKRCYGLSRERERAAGKRILDPGKKERKEDSSNSFVRLVP